MSKSITKPIPDSPPDMLKVVRPWGSFAQYANNQEVTVSLMTVEPGKASACNRIRLALNSGSFSTRAL